MGERAVPDPGVSPTLRETAWHPTYFPQD